jgi:hypothetical protein
VASRPRVRHFPQFEREAEAALGLLPGVHSYALLPIGYPMGRFAVCRWPMSSMKIGGVRLIGICSGLTAHFHDRSSLRSDGRRKAAIYRMKPSM